MTVTLKHNRGRTVVVPDDTAKSYIDAGWSLVEVKEPEPEIPAGDPSEEWKVAQLVAYAAREGIDLGQAKKKDDVLTAIAERKPVEPPASE